MIPLFVFLAIAAFIAVLVGWLQADPGTVEIFWRGGRWTTTVAALVLFAAIGAAFVLLFDRLVGAAIGWARGRKLSRARRGRAAVVDGLTALAAGEPAEARAKAREARRKLGDDALTLLLEAEAAQAAGDAATAAKVFDQMSQSRDGAFLGLRGLMGQAIARGDREEAVELAERAAALRPRAPWARRILLDLRIRAGDYAGARAALKDAQAAKAMPADEASRKRAALLIKQAEDAMAEDRPTDAMNLLKDAEKAAPMTPTLAERLVAAEIAASEPRAAVRAVERAWSREPSHDLVALYAEAKQKAPSLVSVAPSTPLRQARRLASLRPDHPLGPIIVAEAAIAAGEARAARTAVSEAEEAHADQSVWAVDFFRAARGLAEMEGDESAAKRWLEKEAAAPPLAPWACGECGALSQRWRPICARCGALDSLSRDQDSFAAETASLPAGPEKPALTDAREAAEDAAADEKTAEPR